LSKSIRFKFSAIIGAGIGGASTAFFLREHFGTDAEISIFERSQIGGRLATVKMAGTTYEVGGSVIHPANTLMKTLLDKMGKVSSINDVIQLWIIFQQPLATLLIPRLVTKS
jgi:protoporphyrinogen oxidase